MKKIICSIMGLTSVVLASNAQVDYTLQILHASDLEGGINAISRAPNFAALAEYLETNTTADGTVILSAGDNYIPGPFFNAASDFSLNSVYQQTYQDLFSEPGLTNIRGGNGRVDISIMNIIGFDASAIGNHEFDLGSDTFESIIEEDVRTPLGLGNIRWLGAQFPYLSSNLDFSSDSDLSNLFTTAILPNTDFALDPAQAIAGGNPSKIAQATVINEDGELIGVIGATTQRLEIISSPTGTSVVGATDDDMAVLAAQLQPIIDDVIDGDDDTLNTADDVNKIILVTHLQQIALETQLAALLSDVDVIIAGGSDTLLADANDVLRSVDTAGGTYPVVVGNTLIVSTAGEYSYLGRLTVPFDAAGNVVIGSLDSLLNGPIATTDNEVSSRWGSLANAFATGTNGQLVQDLISPVETIVATQDGNVFGFTAVYLDGARSEVRTEETNLGNLTADANLVAAQAIDSSVVISIKNGGGIRSIIGEVDGITGELLPPAANPSANPAKPFGAISELDIANALRFNNELTLLDLSVQDLVDILEHGFADSFAGNTPGRFPQLGGLQVSFTPPVGVTPAAVKSIALIDPDGNVTEVLYEDGVFVAPATRELRIVTLNFLAGGGDGYPFDTLGLNRIDTGIGEQQALQDYVAANFETTALAYSTPEFDPVQDARIQNLDVRNDTIDVDAPVEPADATNPEGSVSIQP